MRLLIAAVLLMLGTAAWPAPTVDGTIGAGEYVNTRTVLGGRGLLAWFKGNDGLTLALSVKTDGWVGLGLGADHMDGAFIFMGYVDAAGKPVFSEQKGQGHRHVPAERNVVDQNVVTHVQGRTIIEFHIPAAKVPFALGTVPFIVASSDSADLKSYHGGSVDAGSIVIR